MISLWERLDTLRAIVDTAWAEDLERQPEAVRTRYEAYAEAYFVIEAVKRVDERLIRELQAGRSVTGYLSAEKGYGKTATAVYLWKRCLDSGIVAVPPFLFRQLKDVMGGAKGWLAYQLGHTHPALVPKLEEAYRVYAERPVDELAKEIAAKQGISEAKARGIVHEYIVQRRDLTTTRSLLEFLREAAGLAQDAGFKGLVIFADEIQDFVRGEEKAHERIQVIADLVRGIRGMAHTPIALMMTMLAYPTEAAIEEQAGDIMDRMRDKGACLRLEDAYGREFPKGLWEYLCTSFGDDEAKRVVEERTLEALGQLCERKDLSNGPRTVINTFKRVAHYWQQNHRPYTPLDLMDDYLQGHIVFEGRELKLTRTLRQLLETPAVQNNAERQQSVKLLAAFPRGVGKEKAGELYRVIEDLADREQWLGEHLTQLAEGYALVGLQERPEPRPLLEEILRDFRRRWFHTYPEQRKVHLAVLGFVQETLPMLFPPRAQGHYANFGGHKRRTQDFERDAHGVLYEILDGCFERLVSRFPKRKACVSVSADAGSLTRFQPPDEGIDLDFRFFLALPENPEADRMPARIVSANQDCRVDFHLNLKRTFGRQFPPDLAFLEVIMAPERSSAQVLLGLSMRMWGWLEEHPDTSEADKQLIEAQRRSLHRYALQLLLPDAGDAAKVQASGVAISGAEQRLIESAFEAKCAELYPEYKPLMVTKEWENYLRRYRDMLGKRPLAERRGRQPFTGSKEEVAKAFGLTHTALDANLRILQMMGVLTVRGSGRGEGSEACVDFHEHPLEILLRDVLQRDGRNKAVTLGGRGKLVKSIEVSRFREMARRKGYLPDELDQALELLVLRQYVQREPNGTVCEFVGVADAEELTHQAQELEKELTRLAVCFRGELRGYERILQEAREYLVSREDDVSLDAAQRKLDELRVRLDEFIKARARELANRLAGLAGELERLSNELEPRELEQQVTGAVEFVRHVDDQRKVLQRQFRQLKQKCEQLHAKVDRTQRQAQVVAEGEMLCQTVDACVQLGREREEAGKELDKLRPYLTGLQQWRGVVAKGTNLRERLDPDSRLRQKLDDDVTTAVMENFVMRRLEALLDWERFKAAMDAIDTELSTEESRRGDEFGKRREQYEKALGWLTAQPKVQAACDPKDLEGSYQGLYQGVLRKLQDWLSEHRELAQRVLNELDYLIRERGIKADSERNLAEALMKGLSEASGRLNCELVKDLEECQRYCAELHKLREELRKVQDALARSRAAKEPPTEEERPLLEVLTAQRRSVEELRRQLPSEAIGLDRLFERLRELYRKGHIEIEVRRRE